MTGKPNNAKQPKHVLDVFQPRTGRQLSDEDARTISHNLVGFFALLGEWASREGKSETTVRASGASGKVDTQRKGGIDKKKARHRSDGQ